LTWRKTLGMRKKEDGRETVKAQKFDMKPEYSGNTRWIKRKRGNKDARILEGKMHLLEETRAVSRRKNLENSPMRMGLPWFEDRKGMRWWWPRGRREENVVRAGKTTKREGERG